MEPYYKSVLSDFQIKKFSKIFEYVFDLDNNGIFEKKDIEILVEKLRKQARVERDDKYYEVIKKFGKDCHESYQDVAKMKKEEFGLESTEGDYAIDQKLFLNIFAAITENINQVEDGPQFLQDFPKVYFALLDRNDDGRGSREELARFFGDYCNVPSETLNKTTDRVYKAWTEQGNRTLDLDRYTELLNEFCFDKEPTGPGQYILGPIDQNEVPASEK